MDYNKVLKEILNKLPYLPQIVTSFAKFRIPFASDFADAWEALFVFVLDVVEHALHYLFRIMMWGVFSMAFVEGLFYLFIAVLRTGVLR